MTNRLAEIILAKRDYLVHKMVESPLRDVQAKAKDQQPAQGFLDSIRAQQGTAIIAEAKRKSPSMGLLNANYDPVSLAKLYEHGGAAAISCLTDIPFFGGSDEDFDQVRAAVKLPMIRKDFMIHPYQIWECRSMGADCVLLIVAGLDPEMLRELHQLTLELNMDALIEVHDDAELDIAVELQPRMIGINNRSLITFETSLETSERLLPKIPSSILKVSESALETREDVERVERAGADGVLIGTAFARAADPAEKLRELLG